MAYNTELADRIRDGFRAPCIEKAMFGGLGFLVDGNMAVAASGQGGLLARVDPADADGLVGAGVEPMVMRGRPMKGWMRVSDDAIASNDDLQRWLDRSLAFVRTLPPK